jgi:hypothetical protein
LGDQLLHISLDAIRDRPVEYALSVVQRSGLLWWGADDGVQNPATPQNMVLYERIDRAACWTQRVLLVAALLSLPFCWREAWPAVLLCAVLTRAYAPIHVEGRYMLPAEPALAFLLGTGCNALAIRKRTPPS